MPGAGFYAIHTDKLRFGSDGRWYADGEPITHEKLARLFSRHLRRKREGGYEIRIDERYHADVEVEDTPYVVVAVDIDDAQGEVCVALSDGSIEPLAPNSLHASEAGVLYCAVKGGTERARFPRPVYHQLADRVVQTQLGDFALRCGEKLHPIRRVE